MILNGTWNNILLRVPTFWQQQPQRDEWVRRFSEFHVQSHNFRDLEANARFEAIVQTKNQFGWSEPTKSFVFHTRLKGERAIRLTTLSLSPRLLMGESRDYCL